MIFILNHFAKPGEVLIRIFNCEFCGNVTVSTYLGGNTNYVFVCFGLIVPKGEGNIVASINYYQLSNFVYISQTRAKNTLIGSFVLCSVSHFDLMIF